MSLTKIQKGASTDLLLLHTFFTAVTVLKGQAEWTVAQVDADLFNAPSMKQAVHMT